MIVEKGDAIEMIELAVWMRADASSSSTLMTICTSKETVAAVAGLKYMRQVVRAWDWIIKVLRSPMII
jgi:hypothetical protein